MNVREATAYIGLGSSLGDRRATLQSAIEALDHAPACRVDAVAAVHETAPVGPSTYLFLNTALRLHTRHAPRDLLGLMHRIEHDHGRTRGIRWGARTLDLDLLMYLDPSDRAPRTSDDPRCRLPHPAIVQRDFVLLPLAELAPDVQIGGTSVAEHLRALPDALRSALRPVAPLIPPGSPQNHAVNSS